MARKRMPTTGIAAPLAALAVACWAAAPAPASAAVSPLPASDYALRPACAAPPAGLAACMAVTLVPATEAARARTHPLAVTRSTLGPARSPAAGDYGLTPQALHSAYTLPASPATPQTIALVDAYNDPTAEADLNAYEREFGLPECTAAGGCFEQLNQNGETGNPPFPRSPEELLAARSGNSAQREEAAAALGWGLEASLDIEAARAACETCRIVLVAADSPSAADLSRAEDAAAAAGGGEISNSWGTSEAGASGLEAPFDHPGIVITASAGDSGYLDWAGSHPGYASFPASSPQVVAVGGTRLSLSGSSWSSESVWNGEGAGGGGCSVEFRAPPWQLALGDWSQVGCGETRAVADVSAVADPYTGFAVHDSTSACSEEGVHWCTVGGTSLSSPIIAATFALAGGAGGVPYPARTLYENVGRDAGSVHDIREGSNGECLEPLAPEALSGCSTEEEAQRSCPARRGSCLAGTGYDGPSGLGSPDGVGAFSASPGVRAEPGGRQAPPSGAAASSPTAGSAVPLAPAPAAAPSPAAPARVRISGLALSARAALAARRPLARRSQVAFAFSLSATSTVRATLYGRVRAHGRMRWIALAPPLALAARSGRTRAHLAGRRRLTAGSYRLTLTATSGASASVTFTVG